MVAYNFVNNVDIKELIKHTAGKLFTLGYDISAIEHEISEFDISY